jgi:L-malate glycosyltransferase
MKKRVLHIIDHIGFGGAQRVVEGILSQNDEMLLMSLGRRKKEINIKNIITPDFSCKIFWDPKMFRFIKEIVRKNKIEIIHCHLAKSIFYGCLFKKQNPRVGLVVHEHGAILGSDKNRFIHYLYIKIIRFSAKYADGFIAISKAVSDKLRSEGRVPARKIKILYNFVDIKKFVAKKQKNKVTKIGFAGRIIRRKGWREFVWVAKLLSRENPGLKFLIAGDGKEREQLLKEIAYNGNIKYLGYVSDMISYYGRIDCLVVPSHWEPMGLVELEAQSSGVPVVASDVPGLNEVVSDNKDVLLFKNKNVTDLLEKIETVVLSDKLRRKLIKNGLINAGKYSLDKYISKLNKIYDGIF